MTEHTGLASLRGANRFYWLIERNDLGAPQYRRRGPGNPWTAVASEAMQFARREDAECYIHRHEGNEPILKAVEHADIAALEARPAPATEGEVERLRDVARSADSAMRFVELVAGQRLSEPAREWYTGEFGDEGEPDFEGAYDSFIEQARSILNDAPRAALSAARPSREGEMRRALEQIAAREDYSPGETEIREIARAALQPQQQKEA